MVIKLPKIVNGKIIYADDVTETIKLVYPGDIEVVMPKFTKYDIESIKKESISLSKELTNLTISNIAEFLNDVGNGWLSYNLKGRRMASRLSPYVTKFSDIIIESDFKTIGDFLVQRFHIYDQIEAELGNERILDEWIPKQMCYVKAFPRGICLHYLVGNLPIAAIYSIIRGIMTKNVTFAKLPSRDPISALGFILSIIETDPDHPISRSISAGYWKHDESLGEDAINIADVVCAWGGHNAMKEIKSKTPPNVPFIEYGPKWSCSVIDLDNCDIDAAAYRVIEDSCFYDQEACFNTQRVYVKGKIDDFLERLIVHFKEFSRHIPYLAENIDISATRSLALKEAQYVGCHVISADDWAIIVTKDNNKNSITHPFNRTLIIHIVDDFSEVTEHLDNNNQSMSVYPWSLIEKYRDEWSSAGICRFVELGWSRMFRSGFTHDGEYKLNSMVRISCIERAWTDRGKYYGLRKNLEEHWFKELHPGMRKLIDERNAKEDNGEI